MLTYGCTICSTSSGGIEQKLQVSPLFSAGFIENFRGEFTISNIRNLLGVSTWKIKKTALFFYMQKAQPIIALSHDELAKIVKNKQL
jgi:hypothetical protein